MARAMDLPREVFDPGTDKTEDGAFHFLLEFTNRKTQIRSAIFQVVMIIIKDCSYPDVERPWLIAPGVPLQSDRWVCWIGGIRMHLFKRGRVV
jgi:hypothetical protein